MKVRIIQDFNPDVYDIIARTEYKDNPHDAIDRLRRYVSVSQVIRIGMVDDVISCIWGLIPPSLVSTKAYLWLLTTDQTQSHQFHLVRHSQIEVARLLDEYDLIIGHCSPKQPKSVRWLRWLGAEFQDPDELGRLPFQIRRK